MSMFVLVSVPKGKLPIVSDWQAAIERSGFDLKLDSSIDAANHTGFWPCQFRGELSGFEFFHDEFVDLFGLDGVEHSRIPDAHSFVFGGSADEAMSAFIAASVLAALTDSVFTDSESAKSCAPEVSISNARQEILGLEPLYTEQAEARKKRNGCS